MRKIHRVSELFQPMMIVPKSSIMKHDASSKSYQLMINAGIMSCTDNGMFALLPLGMRALHKLTQLIDEEMYVINGQKILLPALTSLDLWTKTSRFNQAQSELFSLKDRHGKQFILSPTFEEAITKLISQLGPLKRQQLPLRLYQISSKWRDEMKPRLGLLRSKEFIMKDLYTFDSDFRNAECTYKLLDCSYQKILNNIGIPFIRVNADSGIIGGPVSHEYHYLSDVGEDSLGFCKTCQYYEKKSSRIEDECPKCQRNLEYCNSTEIGHAFLLSNKYSEPLKATFIDNRNEEQHLEMGCYGLGLTRIIAASIEILSSRIEIRWPIKLAPYSVCIINPKEGSKEESVSWLAYDLYTRIANSGIDVIVDDRQQMTIGRRFIDARKVGYPFVIVVGKTCLSLKPLLEVHNVYRCSCINLSPSDTIEYLESHLKRV